MKETQKKGYGGIISSLLFIVSLFMMFTGRYLGAIIILGLLLIFSIIKSKTVIVAHIGNIYYMKGKEEQALKFLRLAAKDKKCPGKILNGYAYLLIGRKEYESAENVLDRVINGNNGAIDKNNSKVYSALIEWKRGRLYNAINLLNALIRDFKNSNSYGYLGYLLNVKGKAEEALEFNKEAYEYSGSNVIILSNLAKSYEISNELEKAKEFYEKAYEAKPHWREFFYSYGKFLKSQGDKEKSKSIFNEGLKRKNKCFLEITEEELKEELANM